MPYSFLTLIVNIDTDLEQKTAVPSETFVTARGSGSSDFSSEATTISGSPVTLIFTTDDVITEIVSIEDFNIIVDDAGDFEEVDVYGSSGPPPTTSSAASYLPR